MSIYTIVHQEQQLGYRVDVVSDEGSRHSVLGFDTEAEAEAWIEADRRLETFRQASPPDVD